MGNYDWMYQTGNTKLKFIKKDMIQKVRDSEKRIMRLTNMIEEIDKLVLNREKIKGKYKRDSKNPKFHAY